MKDSYQLPGLLQNLDTYVPDLTLLRIEDAGHYPMQSHTEEVSRAIRAFVQF
jgi:pimeloyl-ACP methyl ester carboxylesterase